MAYLNQPFTVRRGDDRIVEMDVTEADGKSSVLDGATIRWTYAKSPGGTIIKTKTEADLDISGSKIRNRMSHDETMALAAYQTYWMQCCVTFPDGRNGFRETIGTGSFKVEPTQ